jgi:hypothetical protein
MDRRKFLQRAAESGLLITVVPEVLAKAEQEADPYADFHSLTVYRAYVRGLQFRELPEGYLAGLRPALPLDIVREPHNRTEKKAMAIYLEETKLGYVPTEDSLLVNKLARRGLPLRARLIGVQRDQEPWKMLSFELCLLYPRHEATDDRVAKAEVKRLEGLQRVRDKPKNWLHESQDPLSMRHVWEGYYDE